MALQMKFFNIPVVDSQAGEDEINKFLRTVKLVRIHREIVGSGHDSFWAVAVEHLEPSQAPASGKKAPVDYKATLSPEDFAVYARLRDWRKEKAAQEGVPPYVIFTNEQMAVMVEENIHSLSALQGLPGIGEARIKKYGKEVLDVLGSANPGGSNSGETAL